MSLRVRSLASLWQNLHLRDEVLAQLKAQVEAEAKVESKESK